MPSTLQSPVSVSANAKPLAFGPWACCAQTPGAILHPDQLADVHAECFPASVPGTVAAALEAAGRWDITQPLDADASDWWYRTTFEAPAAPDNQPCYLCCDGLATLAEVWLNGEHLLTTDNMFRAHRLEISKHLHAHNELVIAFRSLANDLQQKRSRPRWKTNLVNHQQLRWRRTTLLGRIPGWSPPVQPVGPWRAIRLDTERVSTSDLHVVSTLEGNVGMVTLHASVHSALPIDRAVLRVGNHETDVGLQCDDDGWHLNAHLAIPEAPLWWPHTHGTPTLLECSLDIEAGDVHHLIALGKVGFRLLHAVQDKDFAIQVNGVPVYCRGACWTVSDIVRLDGSTESLANDLALARDAGINMLRVGGTMIYESDRFYELCDQLGILVWQDFMFANMDYPVDDPAFAANIEAEAAYQVTRLAKHPCVAVYCGNSEVEQQAAMLGMPREIWRNEWFANRLPDLCKAHHPGATYVPSTPSGGAMPFHVKTGVTHYYGVGAYLRSPAELRRADVKFTPECLAFANIPKPSTVNAIAQGSVPAPHDPRWKARVPRDTGAGWDFDDVRDHYLRHFFGVDPVHLRRYDLPRYLQLSRVVSGEMMALAFAEWRSGHSNNQGALVWFFKDLWPGAGWGIIDSLGLPKAAYYYLRRSWQTRQITVTDEGLDGLHLHISNETAEPFNGYVELMLLKDQHVVVARQEARCMVAPRSRRTLTSDELLNGFYDVCYAYRFGPPKHDLVVATLYDDQHEVASEAFHFLQQREPAILQAVQVGGTARMVGAGCYEVALQSDRFLQSVSFDSDGFLPDDNYFHLTPARKKIVRFKAYSDVGAKFKAYVEALNLKDSVRIPLG